VLSSRLAAKLGEVISFPEGVPRSYRPVGLLVVSGARFNRSDDTESKSACSDAVRAPQASGYTDGAFPGDP
jgi:hypothetical protein